MRCSDIKCDGVTEVTNTQNYEFFKKRYRTCVKCGKKYSTVERIVKKTATGSIPYKKR